MEDDFICCFSCISSELWSYIVSRLDIRMAVISSPKMISFLLILIPEVARKENENETKGNKKLGTRGI